MYLVVISIAGRTQVQLMFNNEARAKAAYKALLARDRGENEFEIEVSDDYGTTLMINRDETPMIYWQDLTRAHEGQAEIGIAQAKVQAAMQRKVQNDPAMRFMTASPPGPGMRIA